MISGLALIADAEAAAAEAEHRVELVQLMHAALDRLDLDADLLRQVRLLLRRMRQELVQRRVEEANRRRVALQGPEDTGEVVALKRQQLVQRRLARLERLRENHLPHRVDAIALEEHVFGPAQADADRTERDRVAGLLGRVGIGADAHPRGLRAPLHQLLKALELLGPSRRLIVVDQAGDDLRGCRLHLAGVDLAGGAVDRHPVAFLEGLPVHGRRP
jgi:hypothetical protein